MESATRRQFVIGSAGVLAGWRGLGLIECGAEEGTPADAAPRWQLGACDWSLGKRQLPEAFRVAAEIGLDGVEVSFGEPGAANDLRDQGVRQHYLETSRATGIKIASLAMGILNQVPYATDPRTEQWVADAVEVMPKVGARCCLLAFFGDGDIRDDRAKQAEVVRRLKRVVSQAERAGVVLGIESWLNADDHLRILDEVASPAVQVYYDVANMTERGYDVPAEIRRLGSSRICQLHMKENGALLGRGKVDFAKVREAVEAIDYRGWLILEGATEQGKSLVDCYRENRTFLRSLFEMG